LERKNFPGVGDQNPYVNTPLHEWDGDSKMTPSEVGMEDSDIRDIMEREGINFQNILDQWKKFNLFLDMKNFEVR
jgi:hypothetical protein